MSRYASLIPFLILTVGGGLLVGYLTAPGDWYAELTKPAFNPPNWLFTPVWTLLFVVMGVAGWRVWQGSEVWPKTLWWLQLLLNFAWSPIFFAAHLTGLALIVILLLLATILAFIGAAWRHNRSAAWIFIPYAAWVAFASALNASIFALN